MEFDPWITLTIAGFRPITYNLTGVTSGSGTGTLAGVVFNVGLTTVTWLATDVSGNISECSFTVNIVAETATITLTSAPGTNNQSLCINTPLTNISYSIGNGGTGAGVTGLPAGVTGVYSAGTFTISGTPTESGVFNYTITTTGTCLPGIASGTITVNPDATITLTSAPGTNQQGVCKGNPIIPITYAVGGGGTGVTVTGLPPG